MADRKFSPPPRDLSAEAFQAKVDDWDAFVSNSRTLPEILFLIFCLALFADTFFLIGNSTEPLPW